ncbi:hypothetical protein HD806DRAFT_320578 [Xylariaceae sp. AK1471]|nr:hypothetical protein HD806DRAFT_320578 [Xylariaceae sp. AK1471]
MGRARKKNRRSRPDRKNDASGGLDRDDDFPMHGVEQNLPPSNRRRTQRYTNNNNNSQNSDSRSSKNHNPFNPFNNPFQQPNAGGSRFLDQNTKFQQGRKRNRNQGRENRTQHNYNHHISHNGQRPNQYQPRHRRDSNIISTIDNEINSYSRNHNDNFFHSFSPPSTNSTLSSQTSSPSPGRRTRFCTECSAVRRANLTLRDWLSSLLLGASEVVDGWGEEVGVGRGTGDEMDWQPEPVVRVLILATTAAAAAAAGTGCACSLAQQQQQQYVGGSIGQAVNMNCSGSGDGTVGAAHGANYTTTGMAMDMNPSQWGARQQLVKMITPPESPPSPTH